MSPTREVALHREEWLDAPATGVGGFLARMVSGGLHGVLEAYRAPDDEDEWAARNARMDAAIAAAEVVTDGEAAWLADRIGREGHLHEAEKAPASSPTRAAHPPAPVPLMAWQVAGRRPLAPPQ